MRIVPNNYPSRPSPSPTRAEAPKISLRTPPAPDRSLSAGGPSDAAQARFLVQIDLQALRANLATTWRHPPTPQEVCDFLAAAGFVAVFSGWVATEECLMRLDPAEVLSADPLPAGPATANVRPAPPLARAS